MTSERRTFVGESEYIRRFGLDHDALPHCPSCHEDMNMGEPAIQIEGKFDKDAHLTANERTEICCYVSSALSEADSAREGMTR